MPPGTKFMRARVQVLVVEDSPIVRERLIQKLSQMKDVDVTASGDFKTGLDSFTKKLPEMVILDIQLPDRSGLDLLDTIKKDRPGTVVAIFTNHISDRIRKQSMAKGADFFFDKSTDMETMFAAILRWKTTRGTMQHETQQ